MSYGAMSKADGSSGGRDTFQLSLELDGPPAGLGREFPVDKRTLRAIGHHGAEHERWASTSGIATVWRGSGGALHGRFRLYAKRQMFHILFGWGFDHEILVLGEFTAWPDRGRGMAILSASEGGGLGRPPYQPRPVPKPATQTTQP